MDFKVKRTTWIVAAAMFLLLVFFMFALGPIVLLLTIGVLASDIDRICRFFCLPEGTDVRASFLSHGEFICPPIS